MIVFAHLLNDRSGSPRVLKTVIAALDDHEPLMLFLGSGGDGILGEVPIRQRRYWYRRTSHRALTLLTFLASQLALFVALLRTRGIARDAVIYVNTLLPFGAALYGRLTGRPVIYHVHEMSLSPRFFQAFLVFIAGKTASRLLYVSNAHRALLPIADERAQTLYNVLDAGLAERAAQHVYAPRHDGRFVVLMLAANRRYKGIPEFLALARRLADRRDIGFHLVLSDGTVPVGGAQAPANVSVLPPLADPSDYYANADVIMNLSRPDQCVETFGLTLLEGMAFGLPAIAPPVGGPAELVRDGETGLLVDSRDIEALAVAVTTLADDEVLCRGMSVAARARAADFDPDGFRRGLITALEAVRV